METFQYSPEELKILKNFSTINDNIVIHPDQFAVINGTMKSVVGFYKFTTPKNHQPYGIFNLSEFITLLGIDSTDYELSVYDDYVKVYYPSTNSSTKYNLTPEELLPKVGSVNVKFAEAPKELQFYLSSENIATLKKVTNILALERIYFQVVGDELLLTATNKSLEDATNPYVITLQEPDKAELAEDVILYVNVEELKIMDGDYEVQISSRGVSRWFNKFLNVEYFIGVNQLEEE